MHYKIRTIKPMFLIDNYPLIVTNNCSLNNFYKVKYVNFLIKYNFKSIHKVFQNIFYCFSTAP